MAAHDAPAIQDRYPDAFAVCYGCGRLNAHGLHVRSVQDGEDSVAQFTPRPEQTGITGFVYGGLIASLIDCHAIGAAAAAAERQAGERQAGEGTAPIGAASEPANREFGAAPPRYVTASLHVDFVAPTPHGPPLVLRARVAEASARKSVVDVTVEAAGVTTARARVVAVRIPPSMGGD